MLAKTKNVLMLILLCLTTSVFSKTGGRKTLIRSTPLRKSAESYHSRPASSEGSGCFIDKLEELLKTYKNRVENFEKQVKDLGNHEEVKYYFKLAEDLGELQGKLFNDKDYKMKDKEKELLKLIGVSSLTYLDDVMKIVKVQLQNDPTITALPIFFQDRATTLMLLKYAYEYLKELKEPKGKCAIVEMKVLRLLPYLFHDINEEFSELLTKEVVNNKIFISPTGFNYGGYALAFWIKEDNSLLSEPIKIFNGFKHNENVFSLTLDFGPKFTLRAGNQTEIINTKAKCSQFTFVFMTIEKNCHDFKVQLILRQAYSNLRYTTSLNVPGSVIENLNILLSTYPIDLIFINHLKYSYQEEFRIFGRMAQKQEKMILNNIELCNEMDEDCIYHSIENDCQACAEGSFMQNGNCTSECPPDSYPNNKGECVICTPDCGECADTTTCIKCNDGMFLLHGKCVSECPSNMYPDSDKHCKLCDSDNNCSICESTTHCSKCIPPSKLHKGKCVESCPKNTFYSSLDNKCHSCPTQCASCTSDLECTECVDPFFLSTQKKCLPACEKGFYPDTSDRTCKPCIEHCSSCKNNKECDLCIDGFNKTDDHQCEIICEPGQISFKDICIDCHNKQNCLECNPINIKQCYKCAPPTVLKDDVCVTDCGDGMYKHDELNKCKPCIDNCAVCLNDKTCNACKPPKVLLEATKCVDFCPEGYVLNITECNKCENEDCRQCASDLETCTKCYLPKLLKNGKCVEKCGNGYFLNKEECKSCPTDCAECIDQFTCNKCENGKYLNGALCVEKCPPGTRVNSENKCEKCTEDKCKQCDEDKSICEKCHDSLVIYNNKCLEKCLEGTYLIEGTNVCEDCPENCALCNDDTICMKCKVGWVLQGVDCKEKCDDGFYPWFDICAKCPEIDCKSCSKDSSKCDSCYEGKVLIDGKCEEKCPDGMFEKDSVCHPCLSPCDQCIDETQCLTCVENFFILENTYNCTNNCTDGQVVVNDVCKNCIDPNCSVCKADNLTYCEVPKDPGLVEEGNVTDGCSPHHYVDGYICKPCIENCDRCQDSKKCLACLPDFHLKNDICVSDCGDNYVSIDSTCTKCDTDCKKCKSDDVTYCTECYNKFIFNGDCYEDCPKGTYQDDDTCKPCNDQSCAECKEEGKVCDKCKPGFVLNENKCIPVPCPPGTTEIEHICYECGVKNCSNCDILINKCDFCNDNFVSVNPYQCEETCPDGTHVQESPSYPGKFYCKNCQRYCEKCNEKECLKCLEPFVLQSNTCVSQCKPGYFNNHGVCEKCKEDNCEKCDKDTCLNCEKPYLLSGGQCVENCQSNQFISHDNKCVDCSQDCLKCTDAQTCTQCDDHMKLKNGQCVDDCGEGQVADENNNCLICETPATCLKCSKDKLNQCLECKGNRYLLNNECVEDCGKGYYPEGKKCHSCLPKCHVCSNANECIQCEEGSVLHQNQCLSQCPVGYYEQTGKCVQCSSDCTKCTNLQCTQCAPGKVLEEGKCLSNCSPGFFKKNELECEKCSENCLQCLGVKDCTVCSPGLVIATDGTCVLVCKEGEIVIGGKCKKCEGHCKKCVDTTDKCEVCQDGYLIHKHKCVEKCPAGTYVEGNKCLPCTNNCSICSDQTSCELCTPPFALNPHNQPCGNRNCDSGNTTGDICILCEKGYTAVGGVCTKCDPDDCAECKESITQCTACDDGFYKYNGECYDECPEFTFKVPSSNECKDCNKACKNCTEEEICQSCQEGFFLENHKCVNNCTEESMTNEGICGKCTVEDCLVCNRDFNGCEKCKEGLLLAEKEGDKVCIAECEQGQFEKGKECFNCTDSNCLDCPNDLCVLCTPETALQDKQCKENCDIGYAERNNECFKCIDAYCAVCDPLDLNKCDKCLLPFVLQNNHCKPQCDEGYYKKDYNTHAECQKCPENCNQCIDGKICKKCDNEFVLKDGKCVTSCGKGYANKDGECVKCQTEHCAECFPNEIDGCVACENDFFLDKDQNCVKDCGDGMTNKDGICIKCGDSCITCLPNGECILCASFKYLFEGNCVNKCEPQYSPDEFNECQPCKNKKCDTCNLVTQDCLTCPKGSYLHKGDCVQECPDKTFTNGDNCKACQNNCKKCFNEKECIKCVAPFVLKDGLCQDNCPKFEVDIEGVCTPCGDSSNCYQCSKADVNICLDCKEGTYLLNTTCVTSCPDGTFPSNGKCLPCLDKCKDCNSQKSCNECDDGFVLNKNTCIEECPKGTSEVNKECQVCKDPSCEQCKGDVNRCEKCREPAFPDDGKCITNCGLGKYYDIVNQRCEDCSEGCIQCQSNEKCLKCNSTLALTPEGLCKEQCENGQYKSPENATCVDCENQYCSICDPLKPNSCIECSNNLFKILLPNGEYDCVTGCPEDHFANGTMCVPCKAPCRKCKEETVCDSCIPPLILNDGNCTSICDPGEVERNGVCIKCSAKHCELCDAQNLQKCLICETPYILFKDECYSHCPDKYYNDTVTRKCQECSPTCATCENKNDCTSCIENHYFLNNLTQCVTCHPPSIIRGDRCISCQVENCNQCDAHNEDICKECKEPFILLNQTCVAKCPDGFSQVGRQCVPCSEGCQKCVEQTTCLVCQEGKLSLHGQCVDACPEGFKESNGKCDKCTSNNCLSCPTSVDVCEECKGQLLYKGECVNTCPENTMISNNTCIECQENCAVCDAQGCITCENDKVLMNKECVDNCTDGYYPFLNSCKKCLDPLCEKCTAHKCEKCQGDAKLQPFSYSTCGLTCPHGYYIDSNSDKCEKCQIGCVKCNDGNSCETCYDNFAMFNETCVSSCPENMTSKDGYCVECVQKECTKCAFDKPYICEECATNLYQGKCLEECPEGTHSKEGKCVPCDNKCLKCKSETECTKCKDEFILDKGECVNSCGDGQVKYQNQCLPCEDEKCLQCSEDTKECFKCSAPTFLYAGDCIDLCPKGTYPDKESNMCKPCDKKCDECINSQTCEKCSHGYYMDLQSQCVEHCEEGTYEACGEETRKCVLCDKACKTCVADSDDNCLVCAEGYISYGEKCIHNTDCPSGSFFANNTCKDCLVSYCKTCSDENTCTVCDRGFSLTDDHKCELAKKITPIIKDFVLVTPYTYSTSTSKNPEIFAISDYKGTGVGSDSFSIAFYLRSLSPHITEESNIITIASPKQDAYTYKFVIGPDSTCKVRIYEAEKNTFTLNVAGTCSYDDLYDWKYFVLSIHKQGDKFRVVVSEIIDDLVQESNLIIPVNGRNEIILDQTSIVVNGNDNTAFNIGKLNIMDYIPKDEKIISLSEHKPSNCDYFCMDCQSVCLACPDNFLPVQGRCQAYYVQVKPEAMIFPEGSPETISLTTLTNVLTNDQYGISTWFMIENIKMKEKIFITQVGLAKSHSDVEFFRIYVDDGSLYVKDTKIASIKENHWYFLAVSYTKPTIFVKLQDKQGFEKTNRIPGDGFTRIYNSFIYKIGTNFFGGLFNYKVYINNVPTYKDIELDFSKLQCPSECNSCNANLKCQECKPGFALDNGMCIEDKADESSFIQLLNIRDIWNQKDKKYDLPSNDSMTISLNIRKKTHSYNYKNNVKASIIKLRANDDDDADVPILTQEILGDYDIKFILDKEKNKEIIKNYDNTPFDFFNVIIIIKNSTKQIKIRVFDVATGQQYTADKTFTHPLTEIEIGDDDGYEINMEYSNMKVFEGIADEILINTLQTSTFNLQGTCSKYNFNTKKCKVCLNVEHEEKDCGCGLFGFHDSFLRGRKSYKEIKDKEDEFKNIISKSLEVNLNRDEYSIMVSFKFTSSINGKYRIGCYSNDYLREFKYANSRGSNIVCLEALITANGGITLMLNLNDNNGKRVTVTIPKLIFLVGDVIRGLIGINANQKRLDFSFIKEKLTNIKYSGYYIFNSRPERLQPSAGLKLFGINDNLDEKTYRVPSVYAYHFAILTSLPYSEANFEWLLKNNLALK